MLHTQTRRGAADTPAGPDGRHAASPAAAPPRGRKAPEFEKLKEITVTVILGLLIAVGIHLAKDHAPAIGNMEFSYLDSVMAVKVEIVPAETSPPIVFLDIDGATHTQWGEPPATPRDKLARLIAFAVGGGADQVIVDIDLSRDRTAEPALVQALRASADSGSHVILLRTYRGEQPPAGAAPAVAGRCTGVDIRPTPYDHLAGEHDTIHWASPLFNRDQDGIIRRWRLWEPVCEDGARPGAPLPSVQLTAAALHAGGNAALRTLNGHLQAYAADPASRGARSPHPVPLGDRHVDISRSAFAERIIYGIPWKIAAGARRPLVQDRDGNHVPMLSIIPARVVTEAAVPIDSSIVRGRIVVIGVSHADGRDTQATPLGLMPGALVIANAVQSLIVHRQIDPPPLYARLALEAVVLLLMTCIVKFLPAFAANLIQGIVIVGILPIASVFLLRSGVWLDAMLPLLLTRTYIATQFVALCVKHIPPHRPAPAPAT